MERDGERDDEESSDTTLSPSLLRWEELLRELREELFLLPPVPDMPNMYVNHRCNYLCIYSLCIVRGVYRCFFQPWGPRHPSVAAAAPSSPWGGLQGDIRESLLQ